MHVETMPPARGMLRLREGHAQPGGANISYELDQRSPPATEVENTPARSDPDQLSHILVLAVLSLEQAQGEVAVVLGSAEVSQLSQAEPEDAIGQRIGEVDVIAIGHMA